MVAVRLVKRSDPGYISKPPRFSGRLDLNIKIKKKKTRKVKGDKRLTLE